jgi:hypothetical protein
MGYKLQYHPLKICHTKQQWRKIDLCTIKKTNNRLAIILEAENWRKRQQSRKISYCRKPAIVPSSNDFIGYHKLNSSDLVPSGVKCKR